MWLFTSHGFLSIVADRDRPDRLLVRGRTREDVGFFCEAVGDGVPIETPDADYRWRVTAPVDLVAWFVQQQVLQIDYPNFKDAVAGRQGHERAHTYMGVWSVMRRLQAG